MTDIDFDGAADIADAIEQAGGRVRDFDVAEASRKEPSVPNLLTALNAAMNPTVRVYRFEVAIPAGTTRDIDVPETPIDAEVNEQVVALLAELVAAADGMPVDPDMSPRQNLRALVGQTTITDREWHEATKHVDADGDPDDDEEEEDAASISVD